MYSEFSRSTGYKTIKGDHQVITSATPILRKLHWLPVRNRLTFQILLITYKILNGLAPKYLSDLLDIHQPVRGLRSNVIITYS